MATVISYASPGKVEWSRAAERVLISILLIGSALILGACVGLSHWLPVVILLALALVVLWPVHVSLGLFALLIPFDAISVLGQEKSGVTLTFIVGGAATVVLFFAAVAGNRLIAPPRAALWWTLFVAWGVASAFWALEPELSWQRVPTSLAFLFMFLVAVSVRITPKELSWIELCTIVGGIAAAVYSASQFYSGISYHGTIIARGSMIAGGREEDPNQFAVTLLLPIALALGHRLSTRNRLKKILLTIAVGVIGLGVLLTMSRGAILALSVLVLFFAFRMRAGWRVLTPICSLLLLCLLLPSTFFDRLQGTISSRAAGRLDIWIAGMHAVWHHGLWGAGLSNFPAAYNDVAGAAPIFSGFARGSHNIYLGMLVELGIVGLLCLAFAIRSQLRDASNVTLRTRGVSIPSLLPYQAACYAMLVAGFSLDIVWRKSFWLCWMLLAAATTLERRKAASAF